MDTFITQIRNSVNAFEPFLNNGDGGEDISMQNKGEYNAPRQNQQNTEPQGTVNAPPPSTNSTPTHHRSRGRRRIEPVSSPHTRSKRDDMVVTPTGHSSSRHHSEERRVDTNRSVETRDEMPYPSPPDTAVRARCYRLNMERATPISDGQSGISSSVTQFFGPMEYEPPPHHLPTPQSRLSTTGGGSSRRRTHSWHSATEGMRALQVSASDDASSTASSKSQTAVVVSTARIFRGITVDKNGTIISQNERATRSSSRSHRGKKQGEKSRQAAKIDKAKDLVDEAVNKQGKSDDGESPNMVSIVVIGEYDDMKHLVRDGSKRLRDADGLPDDALLAMNRPRLPSQYSASSSSFGGGNSTRYEAMDSTPTSSPMRSTRKRLSPHIGTGNNSFRSYSPVNKSRNTSTASAQSSTTPPKLKRHPRDKPSSRRMSNNNTDNTSHNGGGSVSGNTHNTHNSASNAASGPEGESDGINKSPSRRFLPVSQCNALPTFGANDGDWSEALGLSRGFHSIWACGTSGNPSSSPNSIWTCGPTGKDRGTISPTNRSGEMAGTSSAPAREGRNESNYDRALREGGNERVQAPGRAF